MLTHLQRFIIFVLFVVSIYTVYVGIKTLLGIRRLKSSVKDTTSQTCISALFSRCVNVQQMITTTFYFSGAVIFLSLRRGFDVLGLSSRPIGYYVAENFMLIFAFGANVFLLIFILHSIQWFTWRCLNSFEKRLTTPA